jgi:hypothetical protein
MLKKNPSRSGSLKVKKKGIILASELQVNAPNFDVDLSRFNTDENVIVSAKF